MKRNFVVTRISPSIKTTEVEAENFDVRDGAIIFVNGNTYYNQERVACFPAENHTVEEIKFKDHEHPDNV